MMGIASSQLNSQNPPDQESQDVQVTDMAQTRGTNTNGHAPVANMDMTGAPIATMTKTPDSGKRKDGKLKTYAKKRASTVKKPRTRASKDEPTPQSSAPIRQASEELGDGPPTQSNPVEAVDETPVRAKATRKKSKKREGKGEDVAPVQEQQESVETPAKGRSRHSKKRQQMQGEQEVEQQLQDELLEDQQVQSQLQQEQEVEVAESEHEDEAEAGAGAEEPEEPEEVEEPEEPEEVEEPEEPEEDEEGFEVPPDSDAEDGEEEEAVVPQKRESNKRKRRVSTEYASPAPTKRQKTTASAKSTPKATPKSTPKPSTSRGQRSVIDFPEQGPFTPVEAEMIDSYMLEYCQENAINMAEITARIQSASKDMTQVYVHIVTELLPNRERRSVQRYCRRHYNNFQRGKWTEDQDELLRLAYAENPNKWTYVGGKVGRMPEDCRDRWRNHISHGDSRHTDVWTEDEELKLVRIVRECLDALVETGMTITRDNEDNYIAWPVVVQKMKGTRNRLQCSMKWRKIKARVAREEALQANAVASEDPEAASSPEATRYKAEAARRYDDMLIGDMYNVVKEIKYGCVVGSFATKNTFWAVVTRLHASSPWTTADRKMVYKRMRPNIVDSGDFARNVDAMLKWLENNFDKEALKKRSVSKKGKFRSEERVGGEESEVEGQEVEESARDEKEQVNGEEDEEMEDANGHVEEQPQSPHVSESEVDEKEYDE